MPFAVCVEQVIRTVLTLWKVMMELPVSCTSRMPSSLIFSASTMKRSATVTSRQGGGSSAAIIASAATCTPLSSSSTLSSSLAYCSSAKTQSFKFYAFTQARALLSRSAASHKSFATAHLTTCALDCTVGLQTSGCVLQVAAGSLSGPLHSTMISTPDMSFGI